MVEFATIIACGGDARRFGADKSLQKLGGTSLIERAIALAETWGGPVALAVRHGDRVMHPRLAVRQDAAPDLGPVGALASGFAFAGEESCSHVLLIACDQPFLPADLPHRLADAIGDAGVALPVSAGHDQNMAALWRADERALATYLDKGRRSLWGFAEEVGIVRVPWSEDEGDPFADIDTRDDLAAAEARLRAK